MYKSTFFTFLYTQILALGTGTRIACGMLTASLRSLYTAFTLVLMSGVFVLYYFDEISRTLLGGGSFIVRAIILMIEFNSARRPSGFTVNMNIPGVRWLLHFPEHFLVFALFALISLIMVHIVKGSLDRESCGVGRGFFRALKSWRFIIIYALCMSIFVWAIGDIYLMSTRLVLLSFSKMSFFKQYLHDPIYGQKTFDAITAVHYWLPHYVRMMIAGACYVSTFLLFAIVASEQCSFLEGVWRSLRLALRNIGLVLSASLFYLGIYAIVIATTLYLQAATFPSLEGLGTKSFVQVVALFSFMSLILMTVHAAFVATGALITGVLVYRMATGVLMPKKQLFIVYRPYESCLIYLIFFLFLCFVVRCGIHVQMPFM